MDSTPERVTEISIVSPYGLRVRFVDGAVGVHNCTQLIKGEGQMIQPLKSPDFFAQVSLDNGAPTWPNGYDLCPDWLRMEMEKAGELSRAAAE